MGVLYMECGNKCNQMFGTSPMRNKSQNSFKRHVVSWTPMFLSNLILVRMLYKKVKFYYIWGCLLHDRVCVLFVNGVGQQVLSKNKIFNNCRYVYAHSINHVVPQIFILFRRKKKESVMLVASVHATAFLEWVVLLKTCSATVSNTYVCVWTVAAPFHPFSSRRCGSCALEPLFPVPVSKSVPSSWTMSIVVVVVGRSHPTPFYHRRRRPNRVLFIIEPKNRAWPFFVPIKTWFPWFFCFWPFCSHSQPTCASTSILCVRTRRVFCHFGRASFFLFLQMPRVLRNLFYTSTFCPPLRPVDVINDFDV